MATPETRPRAVRQQIPYTSTFRDFSPSQRREELAELKQMYQDDRLSIRRIAEQKKSTYGFIRARLLDAGVDISANQKSKQQPEPGDASDQPKQTEPAPQSHRR
jgi:helix-turn-helix protein